MSRDHVLVVLSFLTLAVSICEAQLPPSTVTQVPIIVATNASAKITDQYIVKWSLGLDIGVRTQILNLITNPTPGIIGSLGINIIGIVTPGKILFNYTTAFFGFAAIIPPNLLTYILTLPNMIEYIEQDATITLTSQTENVDSTLWNLDRVDQRATSGNGYYIYAGNGTGINVYVIDTGIRTTHEEFQGRAISGYNAIQDNQGTNDCQGHGTHVAGTVGGRTFGAAKAATIWAVRVLDCNGQGSSSTVVAGVDWVTKNAIMPAIGSMSLGGGQSSSIDDSVKNSISSGIVYTVAAGNNNGTACEISPADVPTAITVGALSKGDTRASYSNWGSCVTLFAPGTGITSASNADDTSSRVLSGTSMATPLVAGVIATYLDQKKRAGITPTPQQVKDDMICFSTKDAVSDPQSSPNRIIYSYFTTFPTTAPPTIVPSTPSQQQQACTSSSPCETYQGTLTNTTMQFQPNGIAYNTTVGGFHRGYLDTTSGGTLLNSVQNNLYLYQYINNKWNMVASSSSSGGEQSISYDDQGNGGLWLWGIQAKGATPTSYTFNMKRPNVSMSIPPASTAVTCTNNAVLNPDEGKYRNGESKITIGLGISITLILSIILY